MKQKPKLRFLHFFLQNYIFLTASSKYFLVLLGGIDFPLVPRIYIISLIVALIFLSDFPPSSLLFLIALLLTEIVLPPLSPRTGTSYQWLTKISSVDESLVAVAVMVVMNDKGEVIKDARIGLISVAPTPMRARQAEEMLRGKEVKDGLIKEVAKVVAEETRPRSRPDYRRSMSAVLAEQTIKEAVARASSAAA